MVVKKFKIIIIIIIIINNSLSLRTKIQVAHRMMWHLKHKADICIRSEILHDIHNLSPMEIVLAEDPMTAQSQLIENI
jgi:hypothetical protein